jgi:hypothetical protein
MQLDSEKLFLVLALSLIAHLSGRTLFDQISDDFKVKVVEKLDEIKALLEVGFEYVCEKLSTNSTLKRI